MKGVPGVMVLLSQACPPSSFSGSLMPCSGQESIIKLSDSLLETTRSYNAAVVLLGRQLGPAGSWRKDDKSPNFSLLTAEPDSTRYLLGHVSAQAGLLLCSLLSLLRRSEAP